MNCINAILRISSLTQFQNPSPKIDPHFRDFNKNHHKIEKNTKNQIISSTKVGRHTNKPKNEELHNS